jgi:hypothetical protein
MMIDVEINREDYGLISATIIKRRLKLLDVITDPPNKISRFGGSDAGGGKKLIPFTF